MTDDVPQTPIEGSSYIAATGYDASRQVLAVTFANGDVWQYAEVPADLVERFHGATSKGAFYATDIKGRFPALKLTGRCASCGARGRIGRRCDDCGTTTIEREARP